MNNYTSLNSLANSLRSLGYFKESYMVIKLANDGGDPIEKFKSKRFLNAIKRVIIDYVGYDKFVEKSVEPLNEQEIIDISMDIYEGIK